MLGSRGKYLLGGGYPFVISVPGVVALFTPGAVSHFVVLCFLPGRLGPSLVSGLSYFWVCLSVFVFYVL